jgi:hypothetical protein
MERKRIDIELTPQQYEQLKPYIYTWGDNPQASIFFIVSGKRSELGGVIAEAQCAILPINDAKAVINLLRKFFGIKPYKLTRKKKTKVNESRS